MTKSLAVGVVLFMQLGHLDYKMFSPRVVSSELEL